MWQRLESKALTLGRRRHPETDPARSALPSPRPMSLVLNVLIFAVAWTHVLLAPYTKVEESFNLHAIHDLILHGGHADALQKVKNGLVIISRLLIRPVLFPSLIIKSFLEPYPAHLWVA